MAGQSLCTRCPRCYVTASFDHTHAMPIKLVYTALHVDMPRMAKFSFSPWSHVQQFHSHQISELCDSTTYRDNGKALHPAQRLLTTATWRLLPSRPSRTILTNFSRLLRRKHSACACTARLLCLCNHVTRCVVGLWSTSTGTHCHVCTYTCTLCTVYCTWKVPAACLQPTLACHGSLLCLVFSPTMATSSAFIFSGDAASPISAMTAFTVTRKANTSNIRH